MLFFYLIACLPVAAGAALWVFKREVVWWEWLVGSAAGFLVSAIMHGVFIFGMTSDYETWSGHVAKATFHPEWVERYTEAVYKDEDHKGSDGRTHTRRVFSHYETKYRTHHQFWDCDDTLGENHRIERPLFHEMSANFGGHKAVDGGKSGFYSGDPNIYVAHKNTPFVYPTTAWRMFENRVKAAPSLFSFAKVPDGASVFPYPGNDNWMSSNRLMGAGAISTLEWDRMNSRLGPSSKVNVIAVGFGDAGGDAGRWQQAAWVGGRKNDLVLCYGGSPDKPTWAFVFGWSESEVAKRNLESILLRGPVDDSIIPLVEAEIRANYVIKDWSKFDYISIEPPTWAYVVLLLVMAATQGGFWYWAMANPEKKDA
jgi:hypothetical protein